MHKAVGIIRRGKRKAFSLIELLVVMGIIGLLAAMGLPALRGMASSNDINSATRQLLDDLAYARLRAINQRTTVYVVFNSPTLATNVPWTSQQRDQVDKYLSGQYTSYALFAKRRLGDQPGVTNLTYLTEWKSLPEGTFIAPHKFQYWNRSQWAMNYMSTNRPFAYFPDIPFPDEAGRRVELPAIAFDYEGRLTYPEGFQHGLNERIGISKGSIVIPINPNTKRPLPDTPAEAIETGRMNWTNNPIIVVDWLTGRPVTIERKEPSS